MNTVHPHVLAEAVKKTLSIYMAELGNQSAMDIHDMVIRHVEKAMLEWTLDETKGNQTKAAKMLGISRNTLRKKLEQYRIYNE
jgi:Fis family transcriptional regulator